MQAELQRQGKDVTQLDSARYDKQVQSIFSEFEKRFTDFTSIECFPFGVSIDVDDIDSKVVSLFHLDSSAAENLILTLQNDIDIKSRATPGMVLEHTARTKVSHPRKMCLEPDSPLWINLYLWFCFLSHENHQVQSTVQLHND